MTNRKSFIIGIKGIKLRTEEIQFLKKQQEEIKRKKEFDAFSKQYLEKNELYHSKHHTNNLELIVFDL